MFVLSLNEATCLSGECWLHCKGDFEICRELVHSRFEVILRRVYVLCAQLDCQSDVSLFDIMSNYVNGCPISYFLTKRAVSSFIHSRNYAFGSNS